MKIAPATMMPDEAPIDCMMTFCPSMFFAQHVADAYGDNGDRYGCFEHLADAQAQIGCGGGEENGHQQAHRNRIGVTSFGLASAGIIGTYSSPGLSSRYALSGRD